MKVICVAAARPNFMKVKPVVDTLEARGCEVVLVHTGQHYSAEMSDVFFGDLGLRPPDVHLGIGSGTHAEQTGQTMMAFEPVVESTAPDVVVVFGDVNATLACALVAAKLRVRLAHVEAGARSGDRSMPEEVNRVVADAVSDILFAADEDAVDHLRREGHAEEAVHLVGNVMVDTLLANRERARGTGTLQRLGLDERGYVLVTLHRPGNVDEPHVLRGILEAIGRISASIPVVFPVHPRTRSRLHDQHVDVGIRLVDPVGYLDAIHLMDHARLVVTDSGGMQVETTVLGVPCLTVRDTTEWPATVREGTNVLVGTDSHRIVEAALDALETRPEARRPGLWDGRASERIAAALTVRDS